MNWSIKLNIENSIPSIFCVLVYFLLVLLFIPQTGDASTVYVLPASQTVYEGDTFIAEVHIDAEGSQERNIDLRGVFPKDKLDVADIFQGGRVPKHAVFLNDQGVIHLGAESRNGFEGDVVLGRIVFLAKERGKASLVFEFPSEEPTSATTGDRKDSTFLEGNYTIVEKPQGMVVVSSPTHQEQTAWYRNTTLRIRVNLSEGSVYSYDLRGDPLADVDEIPDRPQGDLLWIGDMEYAWLDSGIYYFHIRECAKRFNEAEPCVWGPKTTFRAMIDGTAPEEFQPTIENIEGVHHVVFAANDLLSGIDHYEISEGPNKRRSGDPNGDIEGWQRAESPYVLNDQRLRSVVSVKAIDLAGNERIIEIVPERKFGSEDAWSLVVLVLAAGVLGIWIFTVRRAKPANRPQ